MRHLRCGGRTEPRWVLDDVGDTVAVGWCPRCGYPPPDRELSRTIEPADIPGALLLQAMRGPERVQ